MRNYKKTRKEQRQSLIFSIILGVLLFGVVGFLVVANFRISHKRAEMNTRIESLIKEVQVLEERRAQLQAQISQTGEESYLEKEARERFNLKKPGESVVTILPSEEETESMEEAEGKWWNPFTW